MYSWFMKILYALQKYEKSIFLAGPTPRDPAVPSWRPEAIQLLEKLGFAGTVIVPETDDWSAHDQYDNQIDWEWEGLNTATVVVFWIPRHLQDMPAFTTNVEYGLTVASSKAVLGAPEGTPKMGYLKRLAQRYMIRQFTTLEETLRHAVWKTEYPFRHNKYTLDELLEGGTPNVPLTAEEDAWLNAKPVGREFGSDDLPDIDSGC